MIVIINDKTYDVTKPDFRVLLETVKAKKTGSYSIYCLEQSSSAMFVDEIFTARAKMLKQIGIYKTKGFKVHYTVKEVKIC